LSRISVCTNLQRGKFTDHGRKLRFANTFRRISLAGSDRGANIVDGTFYSIVARQSDIGLTHTPISSGATIERTVISIITILVEAETQTIETGISERTRIPVVTRTV